MNVTELERNCWGREGPRTAEDVRISQGRPEVRVEMAREVHKWPGMARDDQGWTERLGKREW